jgi:hypothetical protein
LKEKHEVTYYILFSIIAVFLLLVLIYFGVSNKQPIRFYDKLLIGGLLIASCLFGISLAFFPGWYKKILKPDMNNAYIKNDKVVLRKRIGHHPDCDSFKNHVIAFGENFLCTGCLGLAIGSFISIFLILIYLVFSYGNSSFVFYLFFFFGLIMIAFNFIEIMFPVRNKYVHIFSNSLIVLGFFLIIIGIFELTGSTSYAIISLIFSFLFLITRIQLSHRRHSLICKLCSKKCKMY